MQQKRIISLLPSGTEIVAALGLTNQLVGRSHECDYPSQVQRLPVCSEPKYRSEGTSVQISKEVENILQEALSIYKVDAAIIRDLKPTHIITQSQCEVCAVSTDELQQALDKYIDQDRITVLDLNPATLDDVLENIGLIAKTLDVEQNGEKLVKSMKNAFENIYHKTDELADKPTVAAIEWIAPIMVAGHWMMSLIKMAGGINLFTDENKRWVSFQDLV